MNNEMPTWRPWTPEEREAHEAALEHINKLNEEIIKKGELDTINTLRKQIRNDVEEYNLFRQTPYISGNKFNFYRDYLLEQIDMNIAKLKQLVEAIPKKESPIDKALRELEQQIEEEKNE